MSRANRIRQYKMFLERGDVKKAEDQIKNHPGILEETKEPVEPEAETKSKRKR